MNGFWINMRGIGTSVLRKFTLINTFFHYKNVFSISLHLGSKPGYFSFENTLECPMLFSLFPSNPDPFQTPHYPLSGAPHVRTLGTVTAVAGETFRVRCPVAGYPIQTITWAKGGSGFHYGSLNKWSVSCRVKDKLRIGYDWCNLYPFY